MFKEEIRKSANLAASGSPPASGGEQPGQRVLLPTPLVLPPSPPPFKSCAYKFLSFGLWASD